MSDYQCQNCGALATPGHNCDGRVFVPSCTTNSTEATGTRKDLIARKGFHASEDIDGVHYRHPMYGIVNIYKGGTFRIAFRETTQSLDSYLESLPDSSYTDIGPCPYQARCDSCGAVGPLLPDEHIPFSHKPDCSQAKQ